MYEQQPQTAAELTPETIREGLNAVTVDLEILQDELQWAETFPKRKELDKLSERHQLDREPLIERTLKQQLQTEKLKSYMQQSETADELIACLNVLHPQLRANLDVHTYGFRKFGVDTPELARVTLSQAGRLLETEPEATDQMAATLTQFWKRPRKGDAQRYVDNLEKTSGWLSIQDYFEEIGVANDRPVIELLGRLTDRGVLPEKFWYKYAVELLTSKRDSSPESKNSNFTFVEMAHRQLVIQGESIRPNENKEAGEYLIEAAQFLLNTLHLYSQDPSRNQERVNGLIKYIDLRGRDRSMLATFPRTVEINNRLADTVNPNGGLLVSPPDQPPRKEKLAELNHNEPLDAALAFQTLLKLTRSREDAATFERHGHEDLVFGELLATAIEYGQSQMRGVSGRHSIFENTSILTELTDREMAVYRRKTAAGLSAERARSDIDQMRERESMV